MKSSILCLGAIIQLVLANPVKIPLYKRSDFVSTETQNLQNGMMGAVVQIGNPPQNLTMAFDTTTGFSWVTETQCGDANCQGRTAFNTRNSSTITSTGQSFTMDYGDGTVNTTIYLDTFRYGGLTVKNMPFGGAYRMEGFNKGFDGYLGLGRNINLNTSQTQYAKRDDLSVSGFVPNAFQQGSGIASAQFGMYTITSGSGFSQSGTVSASFALDSGNLSPVKRFDYSCQEPDGYLIIGKKYIKKEKEKEKLFLDGVFALSVCIY
jgi:hypothetical protein